MAENNLTVAKDLHLGPGTSETSMVFESSCSSGGQRSGPLERRAGSKLWSPLLRDSVPDSPRRPGSIMQPPVGTGSRSATLPVTADRPGMMEVMPGDEADIVKEKSEALPARAQSAEPQPFVPSTPRLIKDEQRAAHRMRFASTNSREHSSYSEPDEERLNLSENILRREPDLLDRETPIWYQGTSPADWTRLYNDGESLVEVYPGALELLEAQNPECFQMQHGSRVVNIKIDCMTTMIHTIIGGWWTTQPSVNSRIMAVWNEAISHDVPLRVFFLFSVSASKQYCALAEMTAPVQEQFSIPGWKKEGCTGAIPLRFLFIKNVPFTLFSNLINESSGQQVSNMWNGMTLEQILGRVVIERYVRHPHVRNVLVFPPIEGPIPHFPQRPGELFTYSRAGGLTHYKYLKLVENCNVRMTEATNGRTNLWWREREPRHGTPAVRSKKPIRQLADVKIDAVPESDDTSTAKKPSYAQMATASASPTVSKENEKPSRSKFVMSLPAEARKHDITALRQAAKHTSDVLPKVFQHDSAAASEASLHDSTTSSEAHHHDATSSQASHHDVGTFSQPSHQDATTPSQASLHDITTLTADELTGSQHVSISATQSISATSEQAINVVASTSADLPSITPSTGGVDVPSALSSLPSSQEDSPELSLYEAERLLLGSASPEERMIEPHHVYRSFHGMQDERSHVQQSSYEEAPELSLFEAERLLLGSASPVERMAESHQHPYSTFPRLQYEQSHVQQRSYEDPPELSLFEAERMLLGSISPKDRSRDSHHHAHPAVSHMQQMSHESEPELSLDEAERMLLDTVRPKARSSGLYSHAYPSMPPMQQNVIYGPTAPTYVQHQRAMQYVQPSMHYAPTGHQIPPPSREHRKTPLPNYMYDQPISYVTPGPLIDPLRAHSAAGNQLRNTPGSGVYVQGEGVLGNPGDLQEYSSRQPEAPHNEPETPELPSMVQRSYTGVPPALRVPHPHQFMNVQQRGNNNGPQTHPPSAVQRPFTQEVFQERRFFQEPLPYSPAADFHIYDEAQALRTRETSPVSLSDSFAPSHHVNAYKTRRYIPSERIHTANKENARPIPAVTNAGAQTQQHRQFGDRLSHMSIEDQRAWHLLSLEKLSVEQRLLSIQRSMAAIESRSARLADQRYEEQLISPVRAGDGRILRSISKARGSGEDF